MTIFRVQHNKNYTTINNTICKDNRISWKAKGIWLYAFSRPDDWKFHVNDLIKQSTDGVKSLRAGLTELENAGYLVKDQPKDTSGKYMSTDWVFYEVPQEIKEISPQPQNGHAEKGFAEKAPLLSTDSLPSTEKQQQGAAVFFGCLEKIDIPQEEKIWISQHYPEETVKSAVAWATHPSNPPNKCLAASIKHACKFKINVIDIKDERVETNRQWSIENQEKSEKKGGVGFSAYQNHVEINLLNHPYPTIINYDIPEFQSMVFNEIKKQTATKNAKNHLGNSTKNSE